MGRPAGGNVKTRRLLRSYTLKYSQSPSHYSASVSLSPASIHYKMGNFLTACCQPSDREGKDNLSVSISIGECSEPIKDIKDIGASDHKPVNLLATVAQLDNGSSSSEEEQDPGDKDELVKESDGDDDDNDTTSEEEDSTYEQK